MELPQMAGDVARLGRRQSVHVRIRKGGHEHAESHRRHVRGGAVIRSECVLYEKSRLKIWRDALHGRFVADRWIAVVPADFFDDEAFAGV